MAAQCWRSTASSCFVVVLLYSGAVGLLASDDPNMCKTTSILVYDHAFPFQHEGQVPYDYMLLVSVLYTDCIQAIFPWQFHDWWWYMYFVASPVSHKMTQHIQRRIKGNEWVGRFFPLPCQSTRDGSRSALFWQGKKTSKPTQHQWSYSFTLTTSAEFQWKFLCNALGTFVDKT